MNGSGWIGVDLDGTLAHYGSWVDVSHIGEPVPAMLARVQAWMNEGKEVRIFTARVSGADADEARRAIEIWCVVNLGRVLPVTCVKDFSMVELWDDRAVGVVKNTGERIG